MKSGRIVEQGTHKQLMALPEGAYAALAKMQMGTPPSSPLTKQDLEAETDKETAAGTPETPISPQQSLEKQVSIHSKGQQSAKVQNGFFWFDLAKLVVLKSHCACAQISASAPLLQGVKKAVRVSIIAVGAAPLAPKVQPVLADAAATPEEPKV